MCYFGDLLFTDLPNKTICIFYQNVMKIFEYIFVIQPSLMILTIFSATGSKLKNNSHHIIIKKTISDLEVEIKD